MAQPNNKVPDYIEHRVAGLPPKEAALAAGYSQSGVSVTTTRLEAREDVRLALRVAKRQGRALGKIVTKAAARRGEPADDDTPATLDPWKLRDHYDNPLDLLKDVMNNPKAPGGLRIQCAKDALPYCHARKEGGKKKETDEAGKHAAAKGRFSTMAPPTQLRRAA